MDEAYFIAFRGRLCQEKFLKSPDDLSAIYSNTNIVASLIGMRKNYRKLTLLIIITGTRSMFGHNRFLVLFCFVFSNDFAACNRVIRIDQGNRLSLQCQF